MPISMPAEWVSVAHCEISFIQNLTTYYCTLNIKYRLISCECIAFWCSFCCLSSVCKLWLQIATLVVVVMYFQCVCASPILVCISSKATARASILCLQQLINFKVATGSGVTYKNATSQRTVCNKHGKRF